MAKKGSALDPLLVDACKQLGIDPAGVLDWRAYDDKIVLIAGDGRKLQVER